jgi:CHAT domain-containing protein/Tfp pilus assembly protein PilF
MAEADRVDSEVDELRNEGKYDAAIERLRRQLLLRRRHLGETHPDVAASMSTLGSLLCLEAEYAEAESLFQRALAMQRELLGDLHPTVAVTLNEMVCVPFGREDYLGSERLLRDAIDIHRELRRDDHPALADALANLGCMLRGSKKHGEALPVLQEALSLQRRCYGGRHPKVAATLSNLALLYRERGEIAAAEPLYREAIALCRGDDASSSAYLHAFLHNLGVLLRAKGDYVAAESCLRESLDLRRNFFGEEHPAVARSLSSLGSLLQDQGDYAQAESCLRSAMVMRRRLLGNENPSLAFSLNNLGSLLVLREKYGEAEELLREALTIRRKTLGAAHSSIAATLRNIGVLLHRRGELAAAEAPLREALAMDRRVLGEDHPRVAAALFDLALLLDDAGDRHQADRLLGEALSIAESHRGGVIGDERARAAYAGTLLLSDIASSHARVLLELDRPREAMQAAERGRARALLDLLARSDRDLVAQARTIRSPETEITLERYLAAEDNCRVTLHASERRLHATRRREDLEPEEKVLLIEEHMEAVERARGHLRDARSLVLAELKEFWPDANAATVGEIQAALEPGEILMSYVWSPRAVVLLVTAAGEDMTVQGWILAEGQAEVKDLADSVQNLRDHLSSNRPGFLSDAQALFTRLVPGDLHRRVLGCDRIVLLPDGPLAEIPFEALALSGPDASSETGESRYDSLATARFWMDEGPEIAYAPSASLYLNRRKAGYAQRAMKSPDASPSAVVLANPTLDRALAPAVPDTTDVVLATLNERGSDAATAQVSALDQVRLHGWRLLPLPGSEREAGQIAAEIRAAGGTCRVLIGEEATLPNLISGIEGIRFLHIATHGLLGSVRRPYDASLALTQPAEPTLEDIGFLRLDDLIRQWRGRLKECELVVLSACDSRRGVRSGGSILALPWGFMYAGAPSVVASLWRVDDETTAELMAAFYQGILRRPESEKLSAFTEARRTIRRSHPHPYYWAPFVYVGDPR